MWSPQVLLQKGRRLSSLWRLQSGRDECLETFARERYRAMDVLVEPRIVSWRHFVREEAAYLEHDESLVDAHHISNILQSSSQEDSLGR